MQFKSYLQSLLLEMTFQPMGHNLWQGTTSTPLSHNLYKTRLNIEYPREKVKRDYIFSSNTMVVSPQAPFPVTSQDNKPQAILSLPPN